MFTKTIQVIRREALTGEAVAHDVVITTRRWFGIVIYRVEHLLQVR